MIGTLMLLDSGRWAIVVKGETPCEITSGETFAVEIDGTMQVTRMEFAHGKDGGRYVSVDGYRLREGVRAANGRDLESPEVLGERPMTDKERAGVNWWNGLSDVERGRRLIALQRQGVEATVAKAWAAEKATRGSTP